MNNQNRMQGSSIKILQDIYRKYSELLPEELADPSIHKEMANNKQRLQDILDADSKFLCDLSQKTSNRINLKEYEKSDALLIRRGFLQKHEGLTEKQWTKFFIAHFFMCKSTLLHLTDLLLDQLPVVNEYFSRYNSFSSDKRHAFINLTREHQNLIGLAVNIIDVTEEYHEIFNIVWKKLDPDFVDNGSHRLVSAIIHDELVEGTLELLLRGNRGRFTPAPLIRSALEIMVMRTLFNTKYSKKYKGKKISIDNSLILNDILSCADRLKIQFQFGTDCFRKLYSWGSVSTHYASRVKHHEIWHALRFIQHLPVAGLIIGKDEDRSKIMDAMLDDLIAHNKISIR